MYRQLVRALAAVGDGVQAVRSYNELRLTVLGLRERLDRMETLLSEYNIPSEHLCSLHRSSHPEN